MKDHTMFMHSVLDLILKELQIRALWLFFCFTLTYTCCYTFSEEMLFLVTKPFLSIDNFRSSFLSTQLTETFNTYITSSLALCVFFWSPNMFYQLWCFLIPSCNQNQRARLLLTALISAFAFYAVVLVALLWVLPSIWSFLYQFNNTSTNLFRIELQPKIYDFIMLTLRVLFVFTICSQVPVIFMCLFEYNWISAKECIQSRNTLFLCSVLLAAIITPPDIWCQLLAVLPMCVGIELTILYSIIRFHYTEMKKQD